MTTLGCGEAWRATQLIAGDIKLAHSVFAMPFAILAAVVAAAGLDSSGIDWRRFAGQLVLIVLAMVFARTAAMLANRLLDWKIDKANPRTVQRAIPSGRLAAWQALLAFVVCGAAFVLVCASFGWLHRNWWPLFLALPVLTWICMYPLLKRFTALCHLYLGSSLAISPLAAAIAVDPHALANQTALWLLSGMVLCWVAGFDIIYALQDVDIDREQGLFSIPSRWGISQALWISRALHAFAAACLFAVVWIDHRLSIIFGIGAAIVSLLLVYEHLTVARWGTTKIALAFFMLNGIISCLLGALGVIDVLVV